MAEGFSDEDFKKMVKSVLGDARKEAKDLILRESSEQLQEYGDEFGSTDRGHFSDFKRIFINPFTDVAKTALGHLSKVSSSARTAVEKFLRGIPTLIVPFLSARYDDIFSREQQRLQEIQRKYGDIFDKASEIFKGDAKLVAFMLNPGTMLAAAAVTQAPAAILEIAEAISGQSSEIMRVRRSLSINSESTLAQLVLEDEQSDKEMLLDLVNDRDFQRSINDSSKAREIKRDTQKAINDTLNEFRDDARKMAAADTFEKVSKLIDQKVIPPAVQGMKPEDLTKSTAIALTQFKHAYIDGITRGLKMAVKEFSALDIPEGTDLTRIYSKVINEIDSMKK